MTAETKVQRILLVEDNPSDVFLLRTALLRAGLRFELAVIDDGARALAHVGGLATDGGARPDVILLDLNLPKHNGLEILQAIRARAELAQVPVAIYTSSSSPEDRSESERLGVSGYIVKPSRLAELSTVAGAVGALLGVLPRDGGA